MPTPNRWTVLGRFPRTALGRFPSGSSDAVYEVRQGADGVVYCQCPAWRMKQGRASCKHIDDWRKCTYSRPKQTIREITSWEAIRVGAVIEVNSRGDIFLLRVERIPEPQRVEGTELLERGELPTAREAKRLVDFRDVTRIVIPA